MLVTALVHEARDSHMTEQTNKPPNIVHPDGSVHEWHEMDCGPLYGDKPHWHKIKAAMAYANKTTANPERVNNGCMIYRRLS